MADAQLVECRIETLVFWGIGSDRGGRNLIARVGGYGERLIEVGIVDRLLQRAALGGLASA